MSICVNVADVAWVLSKCLPHHFLKPMGFLMCYGDGISPGKMFVSSRTRPAGDFGWVKLRKGNQYA